MRQELQGPSSHPPPTDGTDGVLTPKGATAGQRCPAGRGEGQELPWGSRTRGGNGQRALAWLQPHQHPVFVGPASPYLLSVRQSLSPQARILFWASMCVMALVLSPSMYSTQSPTPTPAWAAFPPGVSCRTERVRGSWPARRRDDLSP